MLWRWLIVITTCAIACDSSGGRVRADADIVAVPDAQGNLAPIADAGPDAEHLIGESVSLDGTGSTDPDGTIVSYEWSIEARPAGSTAMLANGAAATATFTPDEVGTYELRLRVADNEGATDDDTVTIVVSELLVDAGADQVVAWRDTVQLAGTFESSSNPTTVTWKFVTRPGTSTAVLTSPSSTMPTFPADRVGTFVIEMKVTNPAGARADTVTVKVMPPPPDVIAGEIVDVDIGYAGQLVIASTNPSRIRLLDPVYSVPLQEMTIPLSVTPTAIGVSETGEFVTILHDGTKLTRARIPSLQQLATIDTGTTLLDVRHGTANPHAYPAQAGPLMLVNFIDEQVYAGGLVAGPARGRQAPSASYPIYVIELGSAAMLRRFNGGPQNTPFVRDWPYAAGTYALGGDLWFVADSMIVTSLGHVFHISDDPSLDMVHRALLPGDAGFEIVGIAWGFGQIITLTTRITLPGEDPETKLRFYDYATLALEHVVPLPHLDVAGTPTPTRGLAITRSAFDASHVFVLAVAGPSAAVFTVPIP